MIRKGASRGRRSGPGRLLAGLVCGVLSGTAAHANPTGPTVVHGTAQFLRPDAQTLNVTTSDGTIINWQGFSIGRGELTRFIQPSGASAVLNRVTGTDPSTILGRLLSNGRVFLVNPHGIVFGEGAVVDTAGLVASTLGIGDADFLAGRYRFDGDPGAGSIVNRGLVEAGASGVFLLAPSIENSGVIRTAGGDLVLAAGRTAILTSLDLDGMRVEVQAPDDGVLNLGKLVAERGAIGAFAGSIRNAGTIEANAVTVDDDGTVRLVAQGDITLEEGGRIAAEGPSGGTVHIESETGTTWVSGEVSARAREGRGGTVRLLGRRVGLAGARVDASGPGGGGEVLVGGDVSGKGPVPTADATYVSADSTVSADALDDGDGGTVVVFAEDFANIRGRLSARGGPNGGDGGFVETSGHKSFLILHTPDTTAPDGTGGHWLIDPNNIEIVAGNGNTNISGTDPFASTGDGAQLGIALILAALSGGQSVTVQTTDTSGSTEDGDITLSAALDVEQTTGTNTLTLDAHRHIRINAAITDTAGGDALNLVLDATEIVFIHADVTLHGGSLTTNGNGRTEIAGATVTLDGNVAWTVNNERLAVGFGGNRGAGTLAIRNGATVTAPRVFIGDGTGSVGTVTVTGSGSALTTTGTDNEVRVGDEGTGTLRVLDGGLVETLKFDVGRSGTGLAVIRGVADDGTRSRVLVSPANGYFSDDPGSASDDERQYGGFARVGRNAGSRGRLEIREGGLLRVLDDASTRSPIFHLARNRGSVGELLIDGTGSRLEVVQDQAGPQPARGSGPGVTLGRRGRGVTTIGNGGTLVLRGEQGYVNVSRDAVNPDFPDADTGSVGPRSVVNIRSGGRLEVDGGTGPAWIIIGNSPGTWQGSDGVVTVSGPGSAITLAGAAESLLIVGRGEGRGRLEVSDGAAVPGAAQRVVGPNGVVEGLDTAPPEVVQPEADEVQREVATSTDDLITLVDQDATPAGEEFSDPGVGDDAQEASGEQGDTRDEGEEGAGTEDGGSEGDDGEDDEGEEVAEAAGTGDREEPPAEEFPMCPV